MNPYVKKEEQCDVVESMKTELVMNYVAEQNDEDDLNKTCDDRDGTKEIDDLSSEPPLKNKRTALSHLLCDVYPENEPQKVITLEVIESELAMYRGEANLSIDESPLQWWKTREKNYPTLSKLARKYIAVPATSVKSEEIFSTAGNVLTDKRNRLTPEHVNMLFFLHDNL